MSGTYRVGEKKVRPGTYFNVQKQGNSSQEGRLDGVTALLFRSDWGPLNTAVELSAGAGYEKTYGTGMTTDAIAMAFDGGATTAVCCRIGKGGTKGSVKLKLEGENGPDAVAITAAHVGSKAFTVSVHDRLSDSTKRECILYAGAEEFEKVIFDKGGDEAAALVAAFAESSNFEAVKLGESEGTLASATQMAFTPGTDPAVTAADYSDGFAALENHAFNTVCVDTEDTEIHGLMAAFLDRIYDAGQLAQGVVAEGSQAELSGRMNRAAAFNSEKMIYVLNTAVTSAAYGALSGYQTAARIAGMAAAYPCSQSLTHAVLSGITELGEVLTPTQMAEAETMGCLVLSANKKGKVWIDNAINTLITPAEHQDNGWKKIRRTKTRYELVTRANDQADSLIGKVDNDANGRATIVSQIQGIGSAMVEEGKLVSCKVTESAADAAEGDSAWFHIDCVDKDSAEHIYLTYKFQFNTQG